MVTSESGHASVYKYFLLSHLIQYAIVIVPVLIMLPLLLPSKVNCHWVTGISPGLNAPSTKVDYSFNPFLKGDLERSTSPGKKLYDQILYNYYYSYIMP